MPLGRRRPSVVTILSYGQENLLLRQQQQQQRDEEGEGDSEEEENRAPDEKQLTGIGSGVIVSEDGRIITNNHVITGAKRVVVKLGDETLVDAVEVVGDPDSDVATLQLKIDEELDFQFAEMADSDQVEIGDWVLTIGSPFRLEATVSAGIISAKNRTLRRINRGRLIQTDAAINPGNSGGPMVDLDGRVIAISTAIATRNGGYQGIGFAIPINHARWVAEELAQFGKVRRAGIGATIVELNPRIARMFKLPANLGVLVYQIIEGSVADKAGFKPSDVILEFAGERVRDPGDLRQVIERLPIGSMQPVRVYRHGEELLLQIELAPAEDPTSPKTDGTEDNGDADNGSDVEAPDKDEEDGKDVATESGSTEPNGESGAGPVGSEGNDSLRTDEDGAASTEVRR